MTAQAETADKVLTPARADGGATSATLGARVDEIQERAGDLYQRTKKRALEVEGDVEHYVQEKPMKSVLIAAGVGAGIGLVLGVLLARR